MKPARGAAAASTGPAAKQKEAVGKKVFHLLGGSGLLLMNSLSLFSHPIPCAAVIIEEVNFSLIITKTYSHLVQSQAFLISGPIAIFASILIYFEAVFCFIIFDDIARQKTKKS